MRTPFLNNACSNIFEQRIKNQPDTERTSTAMRAAFALDAGLS
jgi:hypothetical protein